jgi:hypothetical protein
VLYVVLGFADVGLSGREADFVNVEAHEDQYEEGRERGHRHYDDPMVSPAHAPKRYGVVSLLRDMDKI